MRDDDDDDNNNNNNNIVPCFIKGFYFTRERSCAMFIRN
jgi:hypothetical protein